MELPRQRLRHPTDCPTRERSGWVGDWQIYVDTAAYLYDVAGFSAEVAARPRRRPAARRPRHRTSSPTRRPDGPEHRPLEPWRARPGGATPPSTCRGSCTAPPATPTSRRPVRLDEALGRLRRRPRRAPAATPTRVDARRAAPARALPLGQRLALRRVARARRTTWTTIFADPRRPTTAPSPPPTCTARPTSSPRIAGLLGDATTRDRYAELAANVARRVAHRVHRRRRPRPARHPGQPRPRARVRARPRRPARSAAARPRRARPRRRHPPRHRLPRHAVPAARSSPTPATSTSPTSCSSRTPSRRGWR